MKDLALKWHIGFTYGNYRHNSKFLSKCTCQIFYYLFLLKHIYPGGGTITQGILPWRPVKNTNTQYQTYYITFFVYTIF